MNSLTVVNLVVKISLLHITNADLLPSIIFVYRCLSECFATNYMYSNRCCQRRRSATTIYERASTIDN